MRTKELVAKVAQIDLGLRDWRSMESAPRDSRWIEIEDKKHQILRAHFAQDLSGSDQPPFSGWFIEGGDRWFVQVHPIRWRPLE